MSVRAFLTAALVVSPILATAAGPTARAIIKDSQDKEIGTATFTPTRGGVRVHVVVAGLTPGKHGIHIHAAAKCEPPDFKTAGGHLNPFGKTHGVHSANGAHVGDLPNLVVNKAGKANSSFVAKGATLGDGEGSLFGPDGTSLVIHADPDDEKTDPAGNSGARIACGVIEKQ
jgi:superoxide dismutase, Cu-Zn family